jgi:inner membrane protein
LDNLTHTLFAATLARTPLSRAGRGTTAALILASNAPDIDIIATAGGAVKYLQWHRGPTHGLLGLVGLGVLAAALVWIGRRLWDQRSGTRGVRLKPDGDRQPDASFAMLLAVSMIGIIFHVAMDLPTSYGIRPLSPFDWHWYAVDWLPIVDIYLLATLVIGLLGRPTPTQARAKAAFVLLLMATNYGVRGYLHHQALELAPRLFGPTLPLPCDPPDATTRLLDVWPRPTRPSDPPPGRRCLVEIAAMPSFTSPFRWRIIAQLSNAYEIHDIDLFDARFQEPESASEVLWRMTLRYPNVWTPAVQKAASSHLGQIFLGFSRFPAARSSVDANGVTTVRWTDVRFAGGITGLDQPAPRSGLFTATVKVAPDGRIVEETLGR